MDPKESDKVYICKRCHRTLRDEQSIKLGYGKICYRKIKKRNAYYLFDIERKDINEIINK